MTFPALKQLQEFLNTYPHDDICDIGGWEKIEVDAQIPVPGGYKEVVGRLSQPLERAIYDMRDDVSYDITQSPLPRKHQTIICMDTFEHLYDPVRAAENIIKSLEDGGYLFLTTMYVFRYHRYPVDTYRYTDNVLKWLFRDLKIDKAWYEEEVSLDDDPRKMGREWRVSIIAHKATKARAKS